MLTQHLSYHDFQQTARRCRSIDFSRLPEGFDLRRYLIGMLRTGALLAAMAIERLTDEEVDLLRDELAEFQALMA